MAVCVGGAGREYDKMVYKVGIIRQRLSLKTSDCVRNVLKYLKACGKMPLTETIRVRWRTLLENRFRSCAERFLTHHKGVENIIMWPCFVRMLAAPKRLTFCLAACAFHWQDHGISDDDMHAEIRDLLMVEKALRLYDGNITKGLPSHWENVLNEPAIKMWKYPHPDDNGLTEYKVHGSFCDISARVFFNIQLDTEYRRKWDDLVEKLDVIDENRAKNEQVVQWVARLPYPFAHREYVFIRRAFIDEKNKTMVISCKAVEHPACPLGENFVRVSFYVSRMVIKPHKSFDDLGFDYLMTYCDDPQVVLPARLSCWIVSQGIPEYITKVHDACLKLRKGSGKSASLKYLIN